MPGHYQSCGLTDRWTKTSNRVSAVNRIPGRPGTRSTVMLATMRAVQFGATTMSTSPISSRPRRANIMSATRNASAGDVSSRSISCSPSFVCRPIAPISLPWQQDGRCPSGEAVAACAAAAKSFDLNSARTCGFATGSFSRCLAFRPHHSGLALASGHPLHISRARSQQWR
jgi:hypothetical protein